MEQNLSLEKDKIILANRIDLDEIYQQNYEESKLIGAGFTPGKLRRKVASIPLQVLNNDPDGQLYLAADPNSPERRVALRRFLGKFPQFKCSTGTI